MQLDHCVFVPGKEWSLLSILYIYDISENHNLIVNFFMSHLLFSGEIFQKKFCFILSASDIIFVVVINLWGKIFVQYLAQNTMNVIISHALKCIRYWTYLTCKSLPWWKGCRICHMYLIHVLFIQFIYKQTVLVASLLCYNVGLPNKMWPFTKLGEQ